MFIRFLKRALRRLKNASRYHLVTRWRIQGSLEDVYAMVANMAEYPRWWGDVFLNVEPAVDGSVSDPNSVADVRTTGWLPYRIRFQAQFTSGIPMQQISVRTTGDFVGRGTWRFLQEGDQIAVSFHWRICVQKPLIRRWSLLLKPLFIANHRWAMDQGQRKLHATLNGTSHPLKTVRGEFA